MKSRYGILILSAVLTLIYTLLRYWVFKEDSIEQLPIYMTNKVISVTGLVLIGSSVVVSDKERRRDLGLQGALLILVHVLLSMMILNPQYFAKFYGPSGLMTWQGEASMLAGTLAAAGVLKLCWQTLATRSENQKTHSLVPGLRTTVILLAALHVTLMGYQVWFDTSKWPGLMPPITILSFSVAFAFLGYRWRLRS